MYFKFIYKYCMQNLPLVVSGSTTATTHATTTSSLNSTHASTIAHVAASTSVSASTLNDMIAVNASITLLVGILQLAMYVLHLGFLTALFSNAMVHIHKNKNT